MKSIHLIRHSKSDWETKFSSDKERPLSDRGIKNAKSLRKYIEKFEFFVDLAFISSSKRTTDTYRILTKNLSISKQAKVSDEIYEFEALDFIKMLQRIDEKKSSVLLLGHNPSLEDLANMLVVGSDSRTPSIFSKFPTSSFLSLSLDSESWEDAGNKLCRIERFWIP
ncbi:phosphohistidine phosphatase [Leptospira perolatii]|uniref:Phosphohistidine phosphatase n=1 Tax=Leptospira perolatii TaxID=2023191 RepID=A0A2M9ZKL5_9LEPT|nr:histidine phosphatase family protein [Leptospira perolatii]PJZ69985.1 phosphohistidine phosphatase [Leptospira perolatii]PJZ72607.1 phosphohistidine phosphatase [Leptospira perolatii]